MKPRLPGRSGKNVGGLALPVALWLLALPCVRAQHTDAAISPRVALDARPLATAPLEDRIAAARSVKVMTSILGIELGSELDEAHEQLDKLCAPGTRPKEEGGEQSEKSWAPGEPKDKDGEAREHAPKPGEEREEGHKVLWMLAGTDYSAIYITADGKERIESITAFLRPEKRLRFDAVGEVAKAPIKGDRTVIWDVLRVGQPLFRVVAEGADGEANSIRLFVVRRGTGAAVKYADDGNGAKH